MSAPRLREQLQSLSIGTHQRPVASAAARQRRIAPLVFLMLVGGLGAAGWYGRDSIRGWWGSARAVLDTAPALDVRPITVSVTRNAPQTGVVLTASGKIVADHQVDVATKVSGQIVALKFEQGDAVASGQQLALIEDRNYRALRDQAAARLARAKATLAFQQVNWARIQTVDRMWSEIELADARRALDEAAADVNAAEAALDFASKQLEDCVVTAPIAGVVLERNVEVGDFVAAEGGRGANANALFASIADMTKLRVEIDVSELDIARLSRGMRCVVTPDAYKDRRYNGSVMWIDPGANYAKATVQVKVRIESPDDLLRVDGSAQVQFLSPDAAVESREPTTAAAEQLWIPTQALRSEADGATFVFVVTDGRLRRVPVRVAERRGESVRVTDGLRGGERIATAEVARLSDGQRVRE